MCACGDTTTNPANTDVNQVSPDTTINKPINPDVGGVVENNSENGFSGTSGKIPDTDTNTNSPSNSDDSNASFGVVNSWTECNTIEEAEALVGFNFDSIKSAEINTISAMVSDDMHIIQATFFDGDNEITIRKSNAFGDVSGDFRVYENVVTEERDGVNITYSGNGETFGLVIWEKDNYSYSISCEKEISKDILDTFVKVIFNDINIDIIDIDENVGGVVMDVNMPEIITIIEP